MAISRWRYAGRIVAGLAGLLWLWTGVVYHWIHFTPINPAARIFAALFVVQAALLFWVGVVRDRLRFGGGWSIGRITGGIIIGYALVVYPALGYFLGHRYPATPTFGAPCPITLFTLGLLVLIDAPSARLLLVIPVLWALVGTMAAFQFGMTEDLALLVAASVGVWCVLRRPSGNPDSPEPGGGSRPGRASKLSARIKLLP